MIKRINFITNKIISTRLFIANKYYFCNVQKPNTEYSDPDFHPKPSQYSMLSESELHSKIKELIKNNKILLFMKGTKEQPLCGYSRFVVQLLKYYKIEDFETVDVLEDDNLRSAVKVVTEWPTFPQLFIKGELIGGCDIVSEMHKDGSLAKLLSEL